MQYLYMGLFALGIAGLDQLTKYWTVENISLFGNVEAIPGLFHFTYVQNTGAAWSSFEGMIPLFVALFAVLTIAIVWEFSTNKLGFSAFEKWCIVAVFGGGLGNVIDRIRLGYVVDMIAVDFIKFPVFNVADCFISCGCILLMIHLLLFNKGFWKDTK